MIRWNKSFAVESVVYSAATNGDVQIGLESLPNQLTKKGRLEAVDLHSKGTRPTRCLGMYCSSGPHREKKHYLTRWPPSYTDLTDLTHQQPVILPSSLVGRINSEKPSSKLGV